MKWSKSGVVLSLRKTKAQKAQTVAMGFKANAKHCPLAVLRAWLAMCERATPESYVLRKVNAKTGVIQDKISAVKDLTAYPKRGVDVAALPVAARVATFSQRQGFATERANDGVQLHAIKDQLRHVQLSTLTDKYKYKSVSWRLGLSSQSLEPVPLVNNVNC